MVGKRFGRLVVLEFAGYSTGQAERRRQWLTRCDCGNLRTVVGKNLRNGNTKSCGCYQREVTSNLRTVALEGERFGRLLVRERVGTQNGRVTWLCLCDCGNETTVRGSDLRTGKVVACGCYRIERSIEAHTLAIVQYAGAHDRIKRQRGSASTHPCADCGKPATDWSYDGLDPDELTEGRLLYSLKVDHYEPRCKPCHGAYDAPSRPRPTHCKHGHEYTPENTARSTTNNSRVCLACRRINNRRGQAARQARQQAATDFTKDTATEGEA